MTFSASTWRQRLALPSYIARHPANHGHVPRALFEAAAFQVRTRLTGKPTMVRLGEMRMWVHIGNAAATKVIYGCPPDWAEMQAWRRLLHPGDLFIDVGANVGTYTLWAADCEAKVISIEPDPDTLLRLRANVALNPDAPITVVEAAAADYEGTVQITSGLDSLTHIGEGRHVRATTLDGLVPKGEEVGGVKIDVEGFEALVLSGAARLLRERQVQAFQLEWNSASMTALGETRAPIAKLFQKVGYRLARPDKSGVLVPVGSVEYGPDMFAVREDYGVE